MANWSTLKAAIASVIKTNGNQEITGATLQSTLNSIVNAVGENATFAGIATPATNPGAPDGPVFYFASAAGTYSNFGGVVLNNQGLVVLYNLTGTWNSLKVYECLQELGSSTNSPMSQKATTAAIQAETERAMAAEQAITDEFNKTAIYNIDTQVPLTTGFYTVATARAAVPSSVRKKGLIITYMIDSSTSITEQFVYDNIAYWLYDDKWRSIGSSGGNMILQWDTDVSTTRKQVLQKERKVGMIISYNNPDYGWINEQYIGTTVLDNDWINPKNWNEIADANTIYNNEYTPQTPLRRYTKGFIDYKDGSISPSKSYYLSELIPVKPGNLVWVDYTVPYPYRGYTVFDSDKNQIQNEDGTYYFTYNIGCSHTQIPSSINGKVPAFIQINLLNRASVFAAVIDYSDSNNFTPFIGVTRIRHTSLAIGTDKRTDNLFDKNNVIKGQYVNMNGTLTATSNDGNITSNYIPVTPGHTYRICGLSDNLCYCIIYNKDLANKLYAISKGAAGTLIKCGANDMGLICSVKMRGNGPGDFSKVMIVDVTDDPTTIPMYKPFYENDGLINESKAIELIQAYSSGNYWANKNIIVCGTSISDYTAAGGKSWVDYFAAVTKANVGNYAMSGSKVGYDSGRGFSATIEEKTSAGLLSSTVKSYEESVINNANSDLFLFEYGYNDFSNLGTDEDLVAPISKDNRNTFVGGMNYVLNELYKLNPFARVVIIAFWNPFSAQGNVVKEVQKKLCGRWNIPLIDFSAELGITEDIIGSTFEFDGVKYNFGKDINRIQLMTYRGTNSEGIAQYDGVHPYLPNAKELIGRIIAQKLNTIY